MTPQQPTTAAGTAVAAAIDSIQTACNKAFTAIDNVQDPKEAFDLDLQLSEAMKTAYEATTDHRGHTVNRLWQARATTLEVLSGTTGRSRQTLSVLARRAKRTVKEGKRP
jgi:hypothetical protein